jgi:dTDP-glucose pyrophosphorylase
MTNVVVPMAGVGSRFASAGYDVPKPLIDVAGIPMIQRAIWGAGIGGRVIYIVQSEHNKEYNLSELLPGFTPELEVLVLEVDGVTEGAASSVLAAKEYINNDELLVICDSDGVVEWEPNEFLIDAGEGRGLDGSIAVFTSKDPKFSYAKTDENGIVTMVAEKDPISENACAGVYYWRFGSLFVEYAEKMIRADKRINGEFYVAPVYNEAIAEGAKVGVYAVDNYSPMGTPEELDEYMKIVTPWIDERLDK